MMLLRMWLSLKRCPGPRPLVHWVLMGQRTESSWAAWPTAGPAQQIQAVACFCMACDPVATVAVTCLKRCQNTQRRI